MTKLIATLLILLLIAFLLSLLAGQVWLSPQDIVSGDPLADISLLARPEHITGVWTAGRRVKPEFLGIYHAVHAWILALEGQPDDARKSLRPSSSNPRARTRLFPIGQCGRRACGVLTGAGAAWTGSEWPTRS